MLSILGPEFRKAVSRTSFARVVGRKTQEMYHVRGTRNRSARPAARLAGTALPARRRGISVRCPGDEGLASGVFATGIPPARRWPA